MARIFIALMLALGLSGCGYDGFFRYPCQDPNNWEKAECQPPLCEANGTCAVDLLPLDMVEESEPIQCVDQE